MHAWLDLDDETDALFREALPELLLEAGEKLGYRHGHAPGKSSRSEVEKRLPHELDVRCVALDVLDFLCQPVRRVRMRARTDQSLIDAAERPVETVSRAFGDAAPKSTPKTLFERLRKRARPR